MALPAPTLIAGGVHHVVAEGTVDVGVGEGQVPAFGANQLMLVSVLAFSQQLRRDDSFQDQVYVTAKAMDNTITDVRLDAVPFATGADGLASQLRLRVDITADTDLYLRIEFHHSTGR